MTAPAPSSEAPARKATLAFIFVTVMLDMLALGVIIPVLPKLVLQLSGGDTLVAAGTYGLFGTTFASMQFLCSPLLGALSDRYGRRPVILLSNFGLGVDYVVMALAPSVPWLLLGRAVGGLCSASVASASAYIADVTPPEKRAQSFGLLSAAFAVGFVVGPALGGLFGHDDPRLPFWIAAGLSMSNALYGLFVLPESLAPARRAAITVSRMNPVATLLRLREHPQVLGLAAVMFLASIAHEVQPSVFVLYTDYRYAWSARTMGLVLAAVGVLAGVVGAGLVRPLVARIGEPRTLVLGLCCGAAGFVVYGLAETSAGFLSGLPLVALWGLSGPAAQALMTRRVRADEQGRLQGAVAGLRGLSLMLGPGLFTTMFARGIDPQLGLSLPGAPFLLAAAVLACAAALTARVTRADG